MDNVIQLPKPTGKHLAHAVESVRSTTGTEAVSANATITNMLMYWFGSARHSLEEAERELALWMTEGSLSPEQTRLADLMIKQTEALRRQVESVESFLKGGRA